MADAARDQRETTLALQKVEPGADAGGPLVLVTTQQNAVMRSDPFEALEPPKEFSRDDVPRIEGESESQYLERWYIFMAAKYEYALQHSRLEHNARLAHWREKEKALDDLETARKEIARLNEVHKNDLRSRAAAAELALNNRPRVVADAAHDQRKTSLEAFLADCDKLDADGDNKELITIVRNAERENFEAEFRGRIERKIQKEAMQTRISFGGVDAGGPGPAWGKVIVDLGVERDELKAKWEAADKEVKRLNQVNFELVTARHGPLRPRKRALIPDGDAGAEQHQSADGVLVDASGFITRLPGEDDLAYQERCYDRLDVEFERATHAYNAAKDEKIRANNRADKALDDLEAARKEIARLNKALQDELRAQRDSAVAELAQKKRRRVDDAAANY